MKFVDIYQAYDDEALKTFANAGLLRRARKTVAQNAEAVRLIAEDTESLTIESDGHTVKLFETGLQTAQCDCPAIGACKHILSAVLWVQTQSPDRTDNESKASDASSENHHTDALDEVLSLALQQILDSLPKAKRRQAIMLAITRQKEAHNGSTQPAEVNVSPQRISVGFNEHPDAITYIAGTGFAGMLSKIERNAPMWHWLALVDIQRQYGDDRANCQSFLATLNHDHPLIADEKSVWQLSDHARALIADVNRDITQLLARGLSHVDEYSANRMQLTSLLARSENLHRLATQLRQLSGKIHGFLRGEQTERELLITLAKLSAHVYQLTHVTGESLANLRGSARHRYHSNTQRDSLTLCPLGANWWQSDGGARGLTLYFYEPNERQIIELTQARGQGKDHTFNQQSAWNQAVWGTNAREMMVHVNTLETPRFNDYGGLASTGSQVAAQIPLASDATYWQQLEKLAVKQWPTLFQQWQGQLITGDVTHCVLLHPEHCGELFIDEIAQCVWWELYDADVQKLHLKLDWQGKKNHKIEQLTRIDTEAIQYVVAQVQLKQHTIELTPLSLIFSDDILHLDLDTRVKKKQSPNALPQLPRYTPEASHSTFFQSLHDNIMATLDSICSSGRLQLTKTQRNDLQMQAHLANQAGLSLLGGGLEQLIVGKTLADNVLKVVFVCDLFLLMQLV